VSQQCRVGLYINASDPLRANQRAALQRYADAMGWVITMQVDGQIEPLIHAASEHTIDLVLCWRLSHVPGAEALLAALLAQGVDLLPLAQSCAAMPE